MPNKYKVNDRVRFRTDGDVGAILAQYRSYCPNLYGDEPYIVTEILDDNFVRINNIFKANTLEIEPVERPLLADAKKGDLCKRRDGSYDQIFDVLNTEYTYPIRFEHAEVGVGINGNFYHEGTSPLDVVSTEPLAPEGSAEWAWQMLILQKPVSHPAEGIWRDTYYSKDGFVRCMAKTGWQLYEEKPEPAYEVGDWVEHSSGSHHQVIAISRDGLRFKISNYQFPWFENDGWEEPDGRCRNSRITRKLDPSEVEVTVTLRGRVYPSSFTDGTIDEDNFLLYSSEGDYSEILFDALAPETAEQVRGLIAKQGEK